MIFLSSFSLVICSLPVSVSVSVSVSVCFCVDSPPFTIIAVVTDSLPDILSFVLIYIPLSGKSACFSKMFPCLHRLSSSSFAFQVCSFYLRKILPLFMHTLNCMAKTTCLEETHYDFGGLLLTNVKWHFLPWHQRFLWGKRSSCQCMECHDPTETFITRTEWSISMWHTLD